MTDKKSLTWAENIPSIEHTLNNIDSLLKTLPPFKVLFCGDRSTAVQFEETITMELKRLPKGAIVVHGGKKGVDTFTAELAKQLGIETEQVEPKEIDFIMLRQVLAFHPDISFAEDTKKIILKAWKAKVPIFVHDLKRKSKFEGDFNNL